MAAVPKKAAQEFAKKVAASDAADAAAISSVRDRRVKIKPVSQQSQYKPAVTALTVILIVRFLNAWMVERRALPNGRELFSIAIVGFFLSLMADVSPKLSKGFSYLILTAVVFGGTENIWRAIAEADEQDTQTGPKAVPGQAGTTQPGTQTVAAVRPQREAAQVLYVNILQPQRSPLNNTRPIGSQA